MIFWHKKLILEFVFILGPSESYLKGNFHHIMEFGDHKKNQGP